LHIKLKNIFLEDLQNNIYDLRIDHYYEILPFPAVDNPYPKENRGSLNLGTIPSVS